MQISWLVICVLLPTFTFGFKTNPKRTEGWVLCRYDYVLDCFRPCGTLSLSTQCGPSAEAGKSSWSEHEGASMSCVFNGKRFPCGDTNKHMFPFGEEIFSQFSRGKQAKRHKPSLLFASSSMAILTSLTFIVT